MKTVADLMAQVLRPIAEHRGLDTWEKVVEFAAEEWYPSRIAFGKHNGRLIQEARKDAELRSWLDWLARSANPRNAKMGRWYLRQLEMATAQPDTTVFAAPEIERETTRATAGQAGDVGLVIYINPELEQLRQLVAGARARLAELEVDFTKEKSRVDVMQAALFRRLREHYQKRDRLRLIVDLETYEKLTSAINRAKDNGDIAALREIANDPHGFILRQGWASLDFSDEVELAQLRRLHETLQLEIIAVLESLNRLRESPDYELCQLSEQKSGVLDELAPEKAKLLEKECAKLQEQATRLAEEIEELTGESLSKIQ